MRVNNRVEFEMVKKELGCLIEHFLKVRATVNRNFVLLLSWRQKKVTQEKSTRKSLVMAIFLNPRTISFLIYCYSEIDNFE